MQWMLVAGATGAVAAPLARRAVHATWRRVTGEEPPREPVVHSTVPWGEAVAWTAVEAVAGAFAQLAARRVAALAWKTVTGAHPPAPRTNRQRRARRVVQRTLRIG